MLVGRNHEIRELTDLVRQHQSALVVGEPGIGKTALVRAALERSGQPVLVGGGLSTLRSVPCAPLARALGVRRLPGDPARVAQRMLSACAGGRVLVVEDLQWADPTTLEVLELVEPTVPLVLSVRSGEDPAADHETWLTGRDLARIELAPLTEEDARDLVHQTWRDGDPVAVSRLVRRCGGNPLLLTQLADPASGAAESLRIALTSRMAALTEEAREAFALLAVAGRPVPDSWLAGAVDELVRARLAVRDGDLVSVVHAVLAEVAADRLEDDVRRDLHGRLGRLTDDADEAARHFEAAGEVDLARKLALQAAAETPLPGRAAAPLAIAARCATGPEANALRLRAAGDLVLGLRAAEALGLLEQIDVADPTTRVEVEVLRSRASWYLGDDDAFRSAIDEASRVGAEAGPQPAARALIERARSAVFLGEEAEGAVPLAARARAGAEAAGIPLARAQMLLGLAYYMADDPQWQPELAEALALARREQDLDTELSVGNNLVTAHESSGDPSVARRLCVELSDRAEQVGAAGWQLQFAAMALNLDLHQAECHRVVPAALELLEEPLDLRARAQVTAALVVALVDVGSVELAGRRLKTASSDHGRELLDPAEVCWLESEAAWAGGRPAQAAARAQEAIDLGFADPFPQVVQTWAAWDLRQEPPALAPVPVPMFAAVHHDALGVAASVAGDHHEARARFEEAAVAWRPYHRRGEFRSRWAAAEAARSSGAEGEARDLLLALEEDLTPRGLAPMLARVHRSLRPLGVRRAAPRTARRTDGLTSREVEVMQLVAAGLTNAEIGRRLQLSRSTVTEMVFHAVAALGCQSRGQAAARFLT